MSIETATQRLTAALAGLESKVAERLERLQAEHQRLLQDHAALQAEAQQLRVAVEAAQAQPPGLATDGARTAELETRTATYRATLTQTLHNLDSLIARVESAAQ
jgi:uncharacterized protein (UPF0335 family)